MSADEEPRKYQLRYSVEEWNRPAESKLNRVRPGISVSQDKYGYTDIIFVASILVDEDGDLDILLMDSTSEIPCSRKILLMVRDQIDHYLEKHCGTA